MDDRVRQRLLQPLLEQCAQLQVPGDMTQALCVRTAQHPCFGCVHFLPRIVDSTARATDGRVVRPYGPPVLELAHFCKLFPAVAPVPGAQAGTVFAELRRTSERCPLWNIESVMTAVLSMQQRIEQLEHDRQTLPGRLQAMLQAMLGPIIAGTVDEMAASLEQALQEAREAGSMGIVPAGPRNHPVDVPGVRVIDVQVSPAREPTDATPAGPEEPSASPDE